MVRVDEHETNLVILMVNWFSETSKNSNILHSINVQKTIFM